MNGGRLRWSAGALLVLAAPAVAQAAATGDVTRTGKTFTVVLHPGKLGEALATRLADEALAAAEAVRPLLDKWQLVPPKPPVLHVYTDAAPFRVLEKSHSKRAFLVDDFCMPDGSEAHVLSLPPLSAAALGELGLPPWVAQRVQRCAGQAIALQVSEAARKEPWLADVFGFALCDATSNPKSVYGVDPCFDDRRSAFARYRAEGNAIDLELVLDVFPIGTRDELATHHERVSLVGQLCADAGSSWARKLLGKLGKPPAPNRRGFVENTLGKDWTKNEARFDAMLANAKPVWTGDGAGAARDGRIVLAGANGATATLSALRKPPAGPYAIRARVEIAGIGQQECRFSLGYDGKTSLSVVFVPDECSVQLWSEEKKKWQRLSTAKAPVAVRKPFDVAIEIDGEIRVAIDGARLVACPSADRDMHVDWHVATNDSVVYLANVVCEPLAPPKKK